MLGAASTVGFLFRDQFAQILYDVFTFGYTLGRKKALVVYGRFPYFDEWEMGRLAVFIKSDEYRLLLLFLTVLLFSVFLFLIGLGHCEKLVVEPYLAEEIRTIACLEGNPFLSASFSTNDCNLFFSEIDGLREKGDQGRIRFSINGRSLKSDANFASLIYAADFRFGCVGRDAESHDCRFGTHLFGAKAKDRAIYSSTLMSKWRDLVFGIRVIVGVSMQTDTLAFEVARLRPG